MSTDDISPWEELCPVDTTSMMIILTEANLRGLAGLFRDAGFATFCDGITGNWVLKLRETGLDTPTVPGIS